MFNSLLVAAALVAGVASQAALTINTPSGANLAAECEPFSITWSGGTAPYFVTVTPNPPGGAPLASFNGETGTSQTWTVNATVGTSLLFNIRDTNGQTQSTAPFQVSTGSGDGCLTSGGSSPASTGTDTGSSTVGATSPGTSGGSTPASTPTSTSPGSSATSKAASGSTSSAKTSGSASPSSSAGHAVGVPAGVLPAFACVLGAALIALLA